PRKCQRSAWIRAVFRRLLSSGLRIVSQRNVVVLLPRIGEFLLAQHRERAADAAAGAARPDYVIDVASARSHERVREQAGILLGARLDLLAVADILAEDDL